METRPHRPGRRLYCRDTWCRDSHATDRRYGVIYPAVLDEQTGQLVSWTVGMTAARACNYCTAYVPTNAERRAASAA